MLERQPVNFLHQQTEKIKPQKPRWLIFLIILGILFIGGCIAKNIIGEYAPNDPEAYDPNTLEAKRPEGFFKKISSLVFTKENELEGQTDDRINILALGMGGLGHDGPYLTDTNMIISIKPSTGQIAMISIPRDLQVDIPGYGYNKINFANSFGETKNAGQGAEFAAKVIEKTFDLKINYYVRLDFKAFEEMIDEVGGITVNVENSFVDQMYPAANSEYQTVQFTKGIQTMNGDLALKFARSRHGNNSEGSDFARAKRQQKIILALKEKVLSFSTLVNPIKINNIKNTLEKHISTNMEFSDIMAFLKMVKELDTQNIIHLVFDDSPNGFLKNGYTAEGAFILEPVTGNFDKINETIKNVFEAVQPIQDNTPAQEKPEMTTANVEIQNGTWVAGMAARMEKRLIDKNFIINQIGNTVERPVDKSGIYQITDKEISDTVNSLSNETHIPIKEKLPEGVQVASTTDILILIGTDIDI